MRKYLKGQSFSGSAQVTGDRCKVHHATIRYADGPKSGIRYGLTWELDFADVTRDELISLAQRGLVIDLRPGFKKSKTEEDAAAWDGKSWKVRDILDTEKRERKSNMDKADDLWGKMTPEEQQAALARLQEITESTD